MGKRGWVWAISCVFWMGCPGGEVSPGDDSGTPPLDAPVTPGTDAPIAPGTDAPIDTFVDPSVDAPVAPDAGADAPTLDAPDATTGPGATGACTEDTQCDDGIACTFDECRATCYPVSDCCHHSPNTSLCGPAEVCHEQLGCVPARACERTSDCEDDDPCTTSESCDMVRRVCVSRILDGDRDGDPPPVCGGTDCNDLRSDVRPLLGEACDRIDNDCDGAVDEAASAWCPAAAVCRDGECGCPDPSQELCSEYDPTIGEYVYRCVATDSDPENCGACRQRCGDVASCVAGECECDVPGLTFCSSFLCTDTTSNWQDCGPSCRYCGTSSNCIDSTCSSCGAAGQACCTDVGVSGRTACRAGLECSGGTCSACGGAGQRCCAEDACGAGLACSAGTCRTCGALDEPCCAFSSCDAATLFCHPTSRTCATRACALPFEPLPTSLLPRCARSTRTCVRACSTGACVRACLDADTTTPASGIDCSECVDLQYFACAEDAGCGAALAAYSCCLEDCSFFDPASCPTECASQAAAWDTCADRSACFVDTGLSGQCYSAT